MNRRSFLRGAIGLLAAPAIVRVASIMPVSGPVIAGVPWWVIDDPRIRMSGLTRATYDELGRQWVAQLVADREQTKWNVAAKVFAEHTPV